MLTFHGHDYNYDASPYLKEPHQECQERQLDKENTICYTS